MGYMAYEFPVYCPDRKQIQPAKRGIPNRDSSGTLTGAGGPLAFDRFKGLL